MAIKVIEKHRCKRKEYFLMQKVTSGANRKTCSENNMIAKRRIKKPDTRRLASIKRREFSSRVDVSVQVQTRTRRATMHRYSEMDTTSQAKIHCNKLYNFQMGLQGQIYCMAIPNCFSITT